MSIEAILAADAALVETQALPSIAESRSRIDEVRARRQADQEARRAEEIDKARVDLLRAAFELAAIDRKGYLVLIGRLAKQAWEELPDTEKPAAEAAIMKEVTP